MANRAVQDRRAVEQSAAPPVAPRERTAWRSNGWESRHEEELRLYFSGQHVTAAGLHSSLGAQLSRMKDGLGPVEFSAQDIPPELRGADKRAEWVSDALEQLRRDGYYDVLKAQYEREPAGRRIGLEALDERVSDDWKRSGRPDMKAKLATGEAVTPAVVVIAIAHELAGGRSIGGITPDCWDCREALRRICRRAAGEPSEPGGEAPKKGAKNAARANVAQCGARATRLLFRAQRAYAKARRGADADEVRRFMAELDAQGAA
ncbi:MAG TPA: hypothetical protein VK540_34490 [Polyangiaceae bacterium]|nr:hypothetical protein [Polyangiaceae bacterium]